MNKLIPLSDFVLEQKKRVEIEEEHSTVENSLELIFNYTEFLKQTLTYEMCEGEKSYFKCLDVEKNGKFSYVYKGTKFICSFPLIASDRIQTVEGLLGLDIELTPSALQAIGIKEN